MQKLGWSYLLEKVVFPQPTPEGRQVPPTVHRAPRRGMAVTPTAAQVLGPAGASGSREKWGNHQLGRETTDCEEEGDGLAKGIENFIVDGATGELQA